MIPSLQNFVFAAALALGSFARADNAPPSPKRPNILFIICDDLNTSSLPCYGNKIVHAPNIDRLAARGVRFERAYCQWPLCLPSRNSFLSGRRPNADFPQGGLLRERFPDVVFMPEYFRKNGYFTARVGKLFHVRTIFKHDPVVDYEDPACWDVSEVGGTAIDPCGYSVLFSSVEKGLPSRPELQKLVDHHELLNKAGGPAYDYWMEMAALNVEDDAVIDGNIAKRISELMEQQSDSGKPWFLAAGFRRPHLLWVAPKKYFDLYNPADMPLPVEPDHLKDVPKAALTRGAPDMTDQQRRKAIASYYACVTEVDHNVGRLLDTLDRLNLWDNTIVLFTSDHGWHLGEHGLWGKVTLFDEAARVPLIIAAPGLKAGVSPRTVEMLDFYPTLAELAGLQPPSNVDGQSLVPLLKEPPSAGDRPAISILRRGATWGKAIYTEQYRYTEWGDNAGAGVELYDHASDPKEYHNLAHDPSRAVLIQQLQSQLRSTIAVKDTDPQRTGSGD